MNSGVSGEHEPAFGEKPGIRASDGEIEWLNAGDRNPHVLLMAAYHALRSYQFGNDSSDLAEEVAEKIEAFLHDAGIDARPGQ